MATTYPTVDVTMMELTPVIVKFKPAGATDYTEIGGTLGNVKVKVGYSKAEIKADQFGTTVLDRRVSGFSATIETEIAQVKNKDLIKILFPHSTEVGTTTKMINFKTNVGDSDLGVAGVLVLHPQSLASTDYNGDWTIMKACASAESEFTYSATDQLRAKIVWNVYMDTTNSPASFMTFGDPATV